MRQLPARCRVSRALHGDRVRWGDQEHLLAGILDTVRGGNWQRGGGKGQRPRPVPRPGADDGVRQMGKARPLGEVRALLDQWKSGDLAELN